MSRIGRARFALAGAVVSLCGLLAAGLPAQTAAGAAAAVTDEPTAWSRVKVGAGGYVTGIVEAVDSAVYIRTDVGGVYRRDVGTTTWVPLTERLQSSGELGRKYQQVEGIAVDPTNANVVYIAVGGDTMEGRIYRSDARGEDGTWRVISTGQIYMNGNANGENPDSRTGGERLVVDPRNANKVYFGSRRNGLQTGTRTANVWKWNRTDVPPPEHPVANPGYTIVVPGPASGSLYVGIRSQDSAVDGIWYRSSAAAAWKHLDGVHTAQRAGLAKDGRLWVTHANGVSIFSGATRVSTSTPGGDDPIEPKPFRALALDPGNALHAVAIRDCSGDGAPAAFSCEMHETTDGGLNWSPLSNSHSTALDWYPEDRFPSSSAAAMFQGTTGKRLWVTDWMGAWENPDIRSSTSRFVLRHEGIEEQVVRGLGFSTDGRLLSTMADISGFRHESLTAYPTTHWHYFNACGVPSDLDVGGSTIAVPGASSTDRGLSWTAWPRSDCGTAMRGGRVAVSADGGTILWAPAKVEGKPAVTPLYSNDRFATPGHEVDGLPAATENEWATAKWLAADRSNSDFFYAVTPDAATSSLRLRVSATRGKTWGPPVASIAGFDQSMRTYGVKGEPWKGKKLWINAGDKGLWSSSDAGASLQQVPNVKRADLIAFGAPRAYPADNVTLYLFGEVEGSSGWLFRSEDQGQHWTNITGNAPTSADSFTHMEGDPNVFGRVYVGTEGRGIYCSN